MEKQCLVHIPVENEGIYEYVAAASSSFQAAGQGIEQYERDHRPLADDAVVKVIVEGVRLRMWNSRERNAKQPTFLHQVKQIRNGSARES